MAVYQKLWPNGDTLTLETSAGGISVTSDENLTGSDREMVIELQTTNQGGKATNSFTVKQLKYTIPQDGYWIHKDTGVKTYFGLEDPSIEDGIMGYPSWMPNCSEVKLPSGVTGFKTYNWAFEDEWGSFEVSYTGFVYSKETIMVGNEALIVVDLSNTSISSIGAYSFALCSSLTSITLPEGITSLGEYCFQGCVSLSSITLPESVTSLGQGCFDYCSSLTLATVLPAIPPSIGTGVFGNVHTSFNIKVPSSSVNAYKAATNWNQYADKISAI